MADVWAVLAGRWIRRLFPHFTRFYAIVCVSRVTIVLSKFFQTFQDVCLCVIWYIFLLYHISPFYVSSVSPVWQFGQNTFQLIDWLLLSRMLQTEYSRNILSFSAIHADLLTAIRSLTMCYQSFLCLSSRYHIVPALIYDLYKLWNLSS